MKIKFNQLFKKKKKMKSPDNSFYFNSQTEQKNW